MELKELFMSLGIGVVAIIAILYWIAGLNVAYSTTAGSTFNSSLSAIQNRIASDLNSTANSLGVNSQTSEGAGESDQQQGLIKKSLSSLSTIGDFISLAPTMLYTAADIIHIPRVYSDIAVSLILIAFCLTLVYLLLLGVNKLL